MVGMVVVGSRTLVLRGELLWKHRLVQLGPRRRRRLLRVSAATARGSVVVAVLRR